MSENTPQGHARSIAVQNNLGKDLGPKVLEMHNPPGQTWRRLSQSQGFGAQAQLHKFWAVDGETRGQNLIKNGHFARLGLGEQILKL